jgi:NADPH:quinone reductase-like Zn-dependent oxidoreductase
VPGVTFSGTVVAAGNGAARFAIGEPVFGALNRGGHAEYIAVPEAAAIAAKPLSLTHAQAAALSAALPLFGLLWMTQSQSQPA